MMSRYQPLADFLAAQKGGRVEISFSGIEALLGFPLPRSAFKYPAWWANRTDEGHGRSRAWRNAGWRTAWLDLDCRRVIFERDESDPDLNFAPGEVSDDLMRRARELTGIDDPELLIREALRALIAREAGARLSRLGGTMPDLEIPPRRRPVL